MKRTDIRFIKVFLFCCSIVWFNTIAAQVPGRDTTRLIQILKGKSLREKHIDSLNSFQTIAGNVILKEGLTIFSCDSASINKTTNILEAFGNIHINQQDSIHTYSQYLKYIGNERIAYLKKGVRLTDKKGTLYTEDLEYDLKTSIGKYQSGGKVVNGKTTLTSERGVYYAETKDVFFKENVHLVDPKYDITTDSMQYNTQTQLATFITATFIKSKDGGDIYTTSGTYDLKNGKAFFGSRSIIKDSTRRYTANNMAFDEASGIAQLEGNAIIVDSVNGYTVFGGQIFSDKNKKTFLASRKPVLIFKGEGRDSTFVAADTLFSGVQSRDSVNSLVTLKQDTLTTTTIIDASGTDNPAKNEIEKEPGTKGIKRGFPGKKPRGGINPPAKADTAIKPGKILPPPLPDSVKKQLPDTIPIAKADTVVKEKVSMPAFKDSAANEIVSLDTTAAFEKDTLGKRNILPTRDSVIISKLQHDSTVKDSIVIAKPDSLKTNAGDTIRYFLAFHNVRIYNDSMQAVCDSLYYSSLDSVFRLFQEPLVFSNKSQVSGDTIHLFTKNKKADRIYVFYNGMMINQVNEQIYNQVAGRTLNGYFKDGNIDYMRSRGQPAESIFYPQDDDSAFTGMNRCQGDVIDIYFVNRQVNKVKFINQVDGTLYPIRQIPEGQRYLPNFEWLDKRRPKNKLELFE
ncbi:MAG: OstA-like protein [Ferruginibacter sp.]